MAGMLFLVLLVLLLPTFTHGWSCDIRQIQEPPPQLAEYLYYCKSLTRVPLVHNECHGMGCSGGTPNCRPVSPNTQTASYHCPEKRYGTFCEDTYGSLSCPDNQRIVVLKATYGRPYANPTCSPGSSGEPDPVCFTDILNFLNFTCEEQNSCGGVVNFIDPELPGFTDPCPGYTSFMVVEYMCTPPVLTAIGCEDAYMSFGCPGNLSIVIKKVTYGRPHPEPSCPANGPEPASPCSMDVTYISHYCDGNNTCSGTVNFTDPAWPGAPDPCPGLTSFLKVEYVCVPEVLTTKACELTHGSMSCPENHSIVVLKAIYGRPYAEPTCPPGGPGEPDYPCYADITWIIPGCETNSCEGPVFFNETYHPGYTDPCPGYTKFLEVKYWCAPNEPVTVDVEYDTFLDCDCQA